VLPAGRGAELRRDMASLVEELRSALAAAFESEEYRRRREAIDNEIKARTEQLLHELGDRAREKGLGLIHTAPTGFSFVPIRDDEPLSEEEFQKLPEEQRTRLRESVHTFQEELAELLRKVPVWERERSSRIHELDREVVNNTVGHLVDAIRKKYAGMPGVSAHVDRVEHDLVENARSLLDDTSEPDDPGDLVRQAGRRHSGLRRYEVNLLVDNGGSTAAPVVFEDNPTSENLVGRVDFMSRFGALVTDFTLIGWRVASRQWRLPGPRCAPRLARTLRLGCAETRGQVRTPSRRAALSPHRTWKPCRTRAGTARA
jgi:hypothetical protein